MIAPYQVAAPQGNLLGGIMDFIGKRRELQAFNEQQALEQATRSALNSQMGYDPGVDPFGMQRFAAGQSNLETARVDRDVKQGDFGMRKRESDSRFDAAQAIGQGLQPGGQSYGMYDRPDVNMLLPGATNPGVLDAIIGRIFGIEDNARQDRVSEVQHGRAKEMQQTQYGNQVSADALAEARRQAAQVEQENRARQYQQDASRAVFGAIGMNMPPGGENVPLQYIPDVAQLQQERNQATVATAAEIIKTLIQSKNLDKDTVAGGVKLLDDIQENRVPAAEAMSAIRALLGRQQEEKAMMDNQKKRDIDKSRELWGTAGQALFARPVQ